MVGYTGKMRMASLWIFTGKNNKSIDAIYKYNSSMILPDNDQKYA